MAASPFTARIGVDGARAGWVVARATPGLPELHLVPRFVDLADEALGTGILVDIPIGLPDADSPVRSCDAEARRRLGARRSSVFPAPSRAALRSASWEEANAANRGSTGRGLPRQSWGIVPKIREVDDLLVERPRLVGRIRESHPELAFAWLLGEPAGHHKATPEGARTRWRALDRIWPGIATRARTWTRGRGGVALDDVADALALLALGGTGRSVPLPDPPPRDACGLPVEIVVHATLAHPPSA
jgi:predicted RNase H-like nuclease